MSNPTMMPISQNFRRSVDWILGAYTDADVTFTNGFQKDAIQNSVGARKSINNWKNWVCDISLLNTSRGSFVVVEDTGTVGLTGRNIPGDEINAMMAREEDGRLSSKCNINFFRRFPTKTFTRSIIY